MKRARKSTPEATEFAAFTRRILRAYGRRPMDPADLAELVELQRELEAAIRDAVRAIRQEGFSWTDIADGLGVAKQTAWERFAAGGEALAPPADSASGQP
jgi:uncharacterized NAD(P)/FAD-binding protein YdhS